MVIIKAANHGRYWVAKSSRTNNKKSLADDLISFGDFVLPPAKPAQRVTRLCAHIDAFYNKYPSKHRGIKSSDLVMGAFYAARPECRSNPDWIGQSANALRDLLYPLLSERISKVNLIRIFTKYATDKANQNQEFLYTFNELEAIYKKLSDLAHHGSSLTGFSVTEYESFLDGDYDKLLEDFILIAERAFSLQQIYIHSTIDCILNKKKITKTVQSDIKFILKSSPDARQYFFSKAGENWVSWLFNNGFFDVLKKKAEDTTKYSYKMPELYYLGKVADKVPSKVAEIIKSTPISNINFNPEVVDQFLHICGNLSDRYLPQILPKIKSDNWVVLMSAYNHMDFEFKAMFKTLVEAEDFASILTLAEVVLSVKTKEQVATEGKQASFDSPFYFNHLTDTDVFDGLLSVSDEYVESAYDTSLRVLENIVNLGSKSEGRTSFDIEDIFYLFDLDFFSVEPGRKHSSYRESVEELAAVVKTLAVRLIEQNKDNKKKLSEIYDEKIHTLPDSQLLWRLRLFILSLAPKAYVDIIEDALGRVFEAKHYHDIVSGAEYLKLLQASFSSLSKKFREDYALQIISHFCKVMKESDDERKKWDQIYGSRILSTIADYISSDLKRKAEEAGFALDVDFEPKPSIGSVEGGFVREESPVSQEQLDNLSIKEITDKLSSEWSPEALAEKYKADSFLSPRNAEGLANAVKDNITNRLPEYLENAQLFFDQDKLNSHYTYSYLNGIKDAVNKNSSSLSAIDLDSLFELFDSIIDAHEGEKLVDQKGSYSPNRTWLADWRSVHSAMVDVLKEMITDVDSKPVINFNRYRQEIFMVLTYLLSYPDPVFADEKIETAKMTTKSPGEDAYISDPFTMAINSVRGRAFETFVLFVYQDGKEFDKDDKIKITSDCMELYETVLKREDTRAIMFLYGHNIPSFYYRNPDWLKKLLPQVFPVAEDKKPLFLAAWEGYLSNNLFQEIFFDDDFQKLYERGFGIVDDESLKQKHFVELDEGIATHLALAFIHYDDFDINSALFKRFLDEGSDKQLAKLIGFVGRSVMSGDNEKLDELVRSNPKTKEKIAKLWDWILENEENPEVFKEFGSWINIEKGIFELSWLIDHVKKTLEKSQGILDWELGFLNSIVKFSETYPKDTLEITKLFLLDSWKDRRQSNVFYHIDKEWLDTFTILYKNPETKDETYKLINDLLLKGGSIFWALEKIVKES